MAAEAQVQDEGRSNSDILLVSQILINWILTMSKKVKYENLDLSAGKFF
jgi:hypothetical protein